MRMNSKNSKKNLFRRENQHEFSKKILSSAIFSFFKYDQWPETRKVAPIQQPKTLALYGTHASRSNKFTHKYIEQQLL